MVHSPATQRKAWHTSKIKASFSSVIYIFTVLLLWAFVYLLLLLKVCEGIFFYFAPMLMSLISEALLFVEELKFIVPILKVNYGGLHSARVKLMKRANPLSRPVKRKR